MAELRYIELEGSVGEDVLVPITEVGEQLPGCRITIGSVRSVGRMVQAWDRRRKQWVVIKHVDVLPPNESNVFYWDNVVRVRGGEHVGHVAVEERIEDGRLRRRLIYVADQRWALD